MSSPAIASNCAPAAISTPSIFGAQILSIEAAVVENYTYTSSTYKVVANRGYYPDTTIDFCNVTVTHTHPGKNDTLHTEVWLPLGTSWNGRLQMTGGGGWVAGLDEIALGAMFTALNEGYVTSGTDAGVPITDFTTAKDWALTSPGNVDYNRLQNFAMIGLHDGALITKSVTESFYGRPADYSYWSGCSQGGRQGHMFAQRYPDVFDGIAASAPAINWAPFFVGQMFPQQVLYELGEFPHPCEYHTLTAAVINACDGNDGLLDGLISHPDSCSFDPYQLIGTPVNCNAPGAPAVISKAAAAAIDAAWHGTRAADGSLLWPSSGYETNTTNGALLTSCSSTGTCMPVRLTLFTDFVKYFVKKDAEYNVNNMTREDFVQVFKQAVREYSSVLNMDTPDLSEFRAAGGKMLAYHGLADEVIPFRGSRNYYDRVTELDPNVHDFYRLFEVPGLGHCSGGIGGQPTGAFDALVNWVENGAIPETLIGTNPSNQTNLLCPYPKQAVFKGQSSQYKSEDFVCVETVNNRLN